MAEVDELLAGIIATDTGIDPSRIVLYNQNYTAPSDSGIYIIIATEGFTRLGLINDYDPDTDEEVKTVYGITRINVEITSKSRAALERKEEILMAIISTHAQQVCEEYKIRISQAGDILDLTLIEGASALHRYRIPVVIFSAKEKRSAITPIEKFRQMEVNTE